MPPATPPATPPRPDEKLPVAIGMRSPTFNLAVWPSIERISGFWIIFVFVSVRTAFAVRLGRVIAYEPPFRLRSWFNVIPLLVEGVPPAGVVVVPFGLIAMVAFCPGRIPRSRRRSVRAY